MYKYKYIFVRGAGDPVMAKPNLQMIDQTEYYRVGIQSGNDLLLLRTE